MARREIGTIWDRKTRNDINENFKELYNEYIDAGLVAEEARQKAEEALSRANSVQEQLNQVVIDGDSSVEAAQARVDADGNTYNTLKERLDDKETEFSSQLTQTNEKLNEFQTYNPYLRYGRIELPSYFNPKGIELSRGLDGKVYHNVNLNFNNLDYDEVLYFDTDEGSKTGGGSKESPYRSMDQCIEHIIASNNRTFKVVGKGRLFREESINNRTISNKFVYIVGANQDENLVVSNAQSSTRMGGPNVTTPPIVWEQYNNIWRAARSATFNVFDLKNKDFYGFGKPLEFGNLEYVESNPNSFFVDGTYVYVNTFDGRKPDEDILVCLRIEGFKCKLENSTLIMENFDFYDGINPNTSGTVTVLGDIDSKFIGVNLRSAGGNATETVSQTNHVRTNGFQIWDVGTVMLFECKTAYNRRDGFNYHYYEIDPTRIKECLVFEYCCVGHESGYKDDNLTNQISTAHEGVNVLRVGCVGHDMNGPGVQDINDCYTICIDCNYFDSKIKTQSSYSTAYRFETSGGDGKAVLINCNGDSTWSITGHENFPVTILNGFPNYMKIKDVSITVG